MAKRPVISGADLSSTTPKKQELLPAGSLSPLEKLAHYEHVIVGAVKSFFEIGRALKEIRDSELYKLKEYSSFEAYCLAEWDLQRRKAYLLIDSAKVFDNLSGFAQLPATESQARVLAALEPEQQRAIWQQCLALGGKPTAAKLAELIEQDTPPQDAPSPSKQPRFTLTPDRDTTQQIEKLSKQLGKPSAEVLADALRIGLKALASENA